MKPTGNISEIRVTVITSAVGTKKCIITTKITETKNPRTTDRKSFLSKLIIFTP
jgi:hypothetical protein